MPSVVSQQINDKAMSEFQISLYSQLFSAWPQCFTVSFLYFLLMLYWISGSLVLIMPSSK